MPSIKTAIRAIVGRTIATQHTDLLGIIETQRASRQEAPRIKARISDCRERIRGNESRQVKLNSALRGYAEDPKKWASHDRDTRAELAELRREIEDLTAKIAADEKALSEIAAFALPPVSTDLMRYHREQVEQAQATAAKIQSALESARGELSALEATPGPAAELRRELSEALAGQALGTVPPEEIEAIEARLTQAEAVTSTASAKARRIEATITGLEQRLSQAQGDLARLSGATPALQWEVLAPELGQAETRYRDAVAALVQASDRYRALATIMSGIRPGATFAPLPDVAASFKDAGQTRLAAALEREQERLAAMGL